MTKKATQKVQETVVESAKKEYDLTEFKTTSSKIRFLASQEMSRADIAKYLNIRYQHVRNVLTQPLKQQDKQ